MTPTEAAKLLTEGADHASARGVEWYFAVLFFVLIASILLMAWKGSAIILAFVRAKIEADRESAKRFEELSKRLASVEDESRRLTQNYGELLGRTTRALEDVAEALRELKHINQQRPS